MTSKLAAVLVAVAVASPAFAQNTASATKTLSPLLKRLPPSQCELHGQLEAVASSDLRVATLDYERQCYRQAEEIVRARLVALQDGLGKAMKATAIPDQVMLERQQPPECALRGQLEAVNPSDSRVAALDYERQCYRQSEAIARQKLDGLQDAINKTTASAKSSQRPVQKRQSRQPQARTTPRSPLYMGIQSNLDPNTAQNSARIS
jgi:hypothetical protein